MAAISVICEVLAKKNGKKPAKKSVKKYFGGDVM